jgi:hypothetical protein
MTAEDVREEAENRCYHRNKVPQGKFSFSIINGLE